jgi:hypothetical protein
MEAKYGMDTIGLQVCTMRWRVSIIALVLERIILGVLAAVGLITTSILAIPCLLGGAGIMARPVKSYKKEANQPVKKEGGAQSWKERYRRRAACMGEQRGKEAGTEGKSRKRGVEGKHRRKELNKDVYGHGSYDYSRLGGRGRVEEKIERAMEEQIWR